MARVRCHTPFPPRHPPIPNKHLLTYCHPHLRYTCTLLALLVIYSFSSPSFSLGVALPSFAFWLWQDTWKEQQSNT